MLPDTPRTFLGSTTFTVAGMGCAGCQDKVTEAISRVHGVETVAVDLATATVTVTVTVPTDRADIAAAVNRAGFTFGL
jgi:copper chaperone CopZ